MNLNPHAYEGRLVFSLTPHPPPTYGNVGIVVVAIYYPKKIETKSIGSTTKASLARVCY